MRSPADVAFALALGLLPLVAAGCARVEPDLVDVGGHRVRVRVPVGWERLDHGRRQLFRQGEAEIVLADDGAASREALRRDLRGALEAAESGRRKDALERVRTLDGAPLRLSDSEQVEAFWRPWLDDPAIADAANPGDLAPAISGLIARVDSLAEPSARALQEDVVRRLVDASRSEVAHVESQSIHGLAWTIVETWDRVSHENPSRFAFAVNDGRLLVLAVQRWRGPPTDQAFRALLGSLEAGSPSAR